MKKLILVGALLASFIFNGCEGGTTHEICKKNGRHLIATGGLGTLINCAELDKATNTVTIYDNHDNKIELLHVEDMNPLVFTKGL